MQSSKEKQGEMRKPSSVTELNRTLKGFSGPAGAAALYITFSQVVVTERLDYLPCICCNLYYN